MVFLYVQAHQTTMKRLLLNLSMTLWSVLLIGIPTAHAVTSPWTWSDLSAQLTEHTNRPVWSVARVDRSWLYTDGQDLWNGGQVYRYDGYTQFNVTAAVRDAGLSRVDDIVSDGTDALLLKNVTKQNNSFEVVRYTNGTFTNYTATLRKAVLDTEGIVSIVGRNGEWFIITTKAHLLQWDGTTKAPLLINLPSTIRVNLDWNEAHTGYNVVHGAPPVGSVSIPLGIVPIKDNQWLLVAKLKTGSVIAAIYKANVFTEINTAIPFGSDVYRLVSNGTTALIASASASDGYPNGVQLYEGGTATYVANASLIPATWSTTRVTWTGSSWMVLHGKELYRLHGTSFENQGRTKDFFQSIASDNAGHVLAGGATSDPASNEPANPLEAKLVLITEGTNTVPTVTPRAPLPTPAIVSPTFSATKPVATVAPTNTKMTDKKTGITSRTWISPDQLTLSASDRVRWNVVASSRYTLKRIDIIVNGKVKHTCTYKRAKGDTVCSYVIVASEYGRGTGIFVNAKITDARNAAAWTQGTTFGRMLDGDVITEGTDTANNNTISTWSWLEPSGALKRGGTTTFKAGAWSGRGLASLELYVRGVKKQSCYFTRAYGNQECSVTLYGNDYAVNSILGVNARAVDVNGNESWSNLQSLVIVDANTQTSVSANPPNAWDWVETGHDYITVDEPIAYVVGGWADAGIQRIDAYINHTLVHTCTFGPNIKSQTCVSVVLARNYTLGSRIVVNGLVTDRNGKQTWTAGKTFKIMGTGATSATDFGKNGAIDLTTNLGGAYRATDRIRITSRATDPDKIQRTEMYVNGERVHTCYGKADCDATVGPFGANLTTITYFATIYDLLGYETTSPVKTMTLVK